MSRRILACLVLSAVSGCGADVDVRPALQPVQGALTVNSKPAQGATVILHPVGGKNFDSRGSRPKGTVGADGKFQVTTYQDGDGAPAGEYAVAVLWFGRTGNAASDWLAGAYAVPDQTGIRVNVTSGNSVLEPIEIKGARVSVAPPASSGQDLDGLGQP